MDQCTTATNELEYGSDVVQLNDEQNSEQAQGCVWNSGQFGQVYNPGGTADCDLDSLDGCFCATKPEGNWNIRLYS